MNRRTRINLYSLFIAVLLLVLSICYAQVLNGTLEVKGKAEGKAQEGVFITEVEYYANNGADTANSAVDQFTGTALKSSVILGANESSSYTYKVTMHNNTDREYVFIGVVANKTDPNTYSNTNIDYSVESVDGLTGLEEYVTIIEPGEYLIFPVTFKYAGTDTSNPLLNSLLNFRFREVPILELSNIGETYTLENIGAGHVEEYEFTVSNYNQEYNNGVPLTYAFEPVFSEDCPLEAKIYDEDGVEVTGSIQIAGDKNTQEDHTYTLKLTWDSNLTGTEYQGKSYTCNVNLVATPDETVNAELAEYADYSIEKQFGVNITTNIRPTLEVTVSDITSTTAKITAVGNDGDGDILQYTLVINEQTYTSDTGIFEVTGLGTGKTYQYTVSVTDGYETVTAEEQLTTECINYVPEYIESTGTQYIDTGIKLNQNSRVEMDLQMTSTLAGQNIFGSRTNATSNSFQIALLSGQGIRVDFQNYQINRLIVTATTERQIIRISNKQLQVGESKADITSYTDFETPGNAYIFDVSIGPHSDLKANAKLYYLKIWQDDILLRDFIPALDENNVACLYDKVTEQYFYNQGTGTFNYELKQVGHIFGNWKVTTPATCIEEGIETRTCMVCGTMETQSMTGVHTYGDWEITIAATCVAEGIQTRTCTVCGEKQTQSIAALEHNYVNGTCSICGTKETLPTTTPYVGYYADTDGDPTTVEGVIFADQGYGNKGSGSYNGVKYTVPKKTSGLKKYYISKESYTGAFGAMPVISQVSGTTGTDRFYVMDLKDLNIYGEYFLFYWYRSAYDTGMSDYSTTTSTAFGTGKQNTTNMMNKWNNSSYGAKNSLDIWGLIKTEVAAGWFVASRDEWSAFAGELAISSSNAGTFGIDYRFWSSSACSTGGAYTISFRAR